MSNWIAVEESKSVKTKCTCCQSFIRTCEKMLVAMNGNDRPIRGERYCVRCEKYLRMNNDIPPSQPVGPPPEEYDGEAGLRRREEYAAYSAAGCTSEFWGDSDAGYIR